MSESSPSSCRARSGAIAEGARPMTTPTSAPTRSRRAWSRSADESAASRRLSADVIGCSYRRHAAPEAAHQHCVQDRDDRRFAQDANTLAVEMGAGREPVWPWASAAYSTRAARPSSGCDRRARPGGACARAPVRTGARPGRFLPIDPRPATGPASLARDAAMGKSVKERSWRLHTSAWRQLPHDTRERREHAQRRQTPPSRVSSSR